MAESDAAAVLSEEVLKGLSLLGQGELAQPAAFKALVDVTLETVLRLKPATAVLEHKALANIDRIALKQGHACLAALFLVSARDASDADTVRGTLEEQRVPGALAAIAAERFAARRDELRALALRPVSSVRCPRVVDVEWRLDYVVKERALDHVNAPVFFVRLHTLLPDGNRDKVDFTCSIEELQDLVSKLRDAAKQTERSAAIFQS